VLPPAHSEQSTPSLSSRRHLSLPSAWPFEPWGEGGAPPSQEDRADGWSHSSSHPWEASVQGSCPSPAHPISPQPPGSQGRPLSSSLVPPGCADPCPWAPPRVAFCLSLINHPPGQCGVREQGRQGASPEACRQSGCRTTPESPGTARTWGPEGRSGGCAPISPWRPGGLCSRPGQGEANWAGVSGRSGPHQLIALAGSQILVCTWQGVQALLTWGRSQLHQPC
jgi:hypothetical protein